MKKIYFFGIPKINEERKESDPESDPEPDPFVRGTYPGIRIRIRIKILKCNCPHIPLFSSFFVLIDSLHNF
jgi:hypothetical protein